MTPISGNDLINQLASGPQIAFTTKRSMFGAVVQCTWGSYLLGNGATEAEAAEQANLTINDMIKKLRATGHSVIIQD